MHSNGVVAKRFLAFTINGCAVVAFRSIHAPNPVGKFVTYVLRIRGTAVIVAVLGFHSTRLELSDSFLLKR
jgi:hypothetical protein